MAGTMSDLSTKQQAIEQLQQLGLKEYEAKGFIALARLPSGTAKEISEIADVPRTRVYDAVRVLETKGLVEIQHSSPQVFRAVSVEEAVETLLGEYRDRTEQLQGALQELETAKEEVEEETIHEVWTLAGHRAITNRTQQLTDEAERELALVIGEEAVLTDRLTKRLQAAQQRGVTVFVGTTEDSVLEQIQTQVPGASVFVSGLGWVRGDGADETRISRLLLIDKETILVSSSYDAGGQRKEQAVFGRGFENGMVAIVRRLISTGAGFDTGVGPSDH